MTRVEYIETNTKRALGQVTGNLIQWSLNPYTGCVHRCTFCYVRGFERRAGRPSDDRYGTNIRVKVNIVEQLRKELTTRSCAQGVTIGTATDPYQPAEGRFRLTRGCIRELGAARVPTDIITRGPMIVRDIDVLTEAARCAPVRVNLSIPTVDLDVWRATEPSTAPPHQRFRAMRELTDAGIDTSIALAPLLPGISDTMESVRRVLEQARENGACRAWVNTLNLRPGVYEHFMEALAQDFPAEVERYVAQYGSRPYLPGAMDKEIKFAVSALKRQVGIADRRTNPIVPELQLSLL